MFDTGFLDPLEQGSAIFFHDRGMEPAHFLERCRTTLSR